MQKTAASKFWPLIFAAVFLFPFFASANVLFYLPNGTTIGNAGGTGNPTPNGATTTALDNVAPNTVIYTQYCATIFNNNNAGAQLDTWIAMSSNINTGVDGVFSQFLNKTEPAQYCGTATSSTSNNYVSGTPYWVGFDINGVYGGAYVNLNGSGDYYQVSDSPTTIDFSPLLGVQPPYNLAAAPIAASSSLWGAYATSSTLAASCDSGNLFSDGICQAFSFIFIPNPEILNGFIALPALAGTKFPFSWIYGVQNEVSTLSASSTSNMIGLQLNLGSLGVGSTTSMGNILPNFEAFGTSTIETYVSPTEWVYFQDWIAFALWLGLIADVFFLAKRLAHPH